MMERNKQETYKCFINEAIETSCRITLQLTLFCNSFFGCFMYKSSIYSGVEKRVFDV